jgi:predicted DsbA family dithiol-disulfide isomerase
VWSDVACPWCFIGKRRLERAFEMFERSDRVQVTWHSYQLTPDAETGSTMTESELLAERQGIPLELVREMFERVTAVAADEGLAYDFGTVRPANTFDAHRLVQLAAVAGAGYADAVVEALMTAHFERGVTIDDREELVTIAEACGLPGDGVRAALAGDAAGLAAGEAVRADIDEARAIGVTGVPFFVVDRRLGVAGAQNADVLAGALGQAWAESGLA